MTSSKEKRRQLGMSHGAARNKLTRALMFSMAERLGLLDCHQCGKPIDSVEEFSIEHIEPWLHNDNAQQLFFDLNNIAFSHQSCNYGAARSARKVPPGPPGTHWCGGCEAYKPSTEFFPSYIARSLYRCRACHNNDKIAYRQNGGAH